MSHTHLSLQERYVISHLSVAGFSRREIARRINRHHTTVSRELRRNGPQHPGAGRYWYSWTHTVALEKSRMARHYRRQRHLRLLGYVEDKLKLQWSPEEIAQRIRIDYPDGSEMRVSHETIYRWVYLDASVEGNLYCNLRRRRKRRRRQKRYGAGHRFLSCRKSITERPEIVEGRERFGDWEGDTVEGKKSSGYIATIVERKSRYLLASKLENKRSASFTEQGGKAFSTIPRRMRHTLTVDNGSEFAGFMEFEKKTGLTVYFADSYAAWQREQTRTPTAYCASISPKGAI